jgi:hypothetical protein
MCTVNQETVRTNSYYYDALFQAFSKIYERGVIGDIKHAGPRDVVYHISRTSAPLIPDTNYCPIDVFTTNYDLCFETFCHIKSLPYHNMIKILANPDVSSHDREPAINIFKLHGSIDLYVTNEAVVELPVQPAKKRMLNGREIQKELLIYPTHGKQVVAYPYLDLLTSFSRSLMNAELCLVIGYSFRDQYINGIFYNATKKDPSLVIIVVDPNANKITRKLAFEENCVPVKMSVNQPDLAKRIYGAACSARARSA